VETIQEAVMEISNLSEGELQERSVSACNQVKKYNSRSAYSNAMYQALESICMQ